MSDDVWLIGAGPMARAHHEVLSALNVPVTVVGRGEASARAFAAELGQHPVTGGLERTLLHASAIPHTAIVAVPVPDLANSVRLLVSAGVQRILVEKPAGLTIDELSALASHVTEHPSVDVRVAYNRRFYGSTMLARSMIAEDGGVQSLRFEFTERTQQVESLVGDQDLLASWFLANSSHVVDLAYYLAGEPLEWKAFVRGGDVAWHPADRFAGAGVTVSGGTFSYAADWTAPGRWGVEVMTRARRLTLQPLEELHIQLPGAKDEETYAAPKIDIRYKPGLFAQMRAFLNGDNQLISLADHADRAVRVFRPMVTGMFEP